ncbi:hypothetical protein A3D00_04170 [Candidatus Woesebacteria bacterium RIFCSPHIGHO2_02_FULL_38_9]|uniref:PIN domain-containing protein n=1 Tax=Candidatus Woesebacteria bacterium RIFCSPHIGHO2_01_FULL_39_28 TaxID=1802496 RepID=A0A1F7YCI1_9BACT|nr:MAG: hypothetical protein A2627_05110 [Candidatus Woesebacteria bacterium RIFCSPHIGHO2_01_FULL_39_28]OGM33760.1 MAG: hypothetical protein A3D00_04170 [Candidatus Woesebacteria bacterium RIFCSPHIGHO2_02_FULL_38_9]OGM57572.1 MAG: hypothetical protein A3A50_06225 [Candidatus Woesebacteria bacterium RIFCSPLOWO2_01_FULL_38_20]
MKYLIDTDYAISFLKGKKEAVEILTKYQNNLAMSVISLAEILDGIYNQPEEKKRLIDLKDFLTGIDILKVDERVATAFAKIRSKLRAKRALLESLDIIIAATAMDQRLVLITGNKKHFERIEGLKIL